MRCTIWYYQIARAFILFYFFSDLRTKFLIRLINKNIGPPLWTGHGLSPAVPPPGMGTSDA